MDYVLLTPDEVGALLDVTGEDVVAMVETGALGGLRVAGHWRVPLKSIVDLLSAGLEEQNMRALERAFNDAPTWNRVFGAHPEVTQSIEAGQFPHGSVGEWLKAALASSRRPLDGQVQVDDATARGRDDEADPRGQGGSGA